MVTINNYYSNTNVGLKLLSVTDYELQTRRQRDTSASKLQNTAYLFFIITNLGEN